MITSKFVAKFDLSAGLITYKLLILNELVLGYFGKVHRSYFHVALIFENLSVFKRFTINTESRMLRPATGYSLYTQQIIQIYQQLEKQRLLIALDNFFYRRA